MISVSVARRPQLAAHASVRDVGRLRLTVRSNISDDDPANGEFTVQGLQSRGAFAGTARYRS